jgi:hypothetical protein
MQERKFEMQFRTQQPDPKPFISETAFSAAIEHHYNEIRKLEGKIAEHTSKMIELLRVTRHSVS